MFKSPFPPKFKQTKGFRLGAPLALGLFLAATPSAFAESRPSEETVERVVGAAVGAILNGGVENPREMARSVTIEELERILRDRAQRRGRGEAPTRRDGRRSPAPSSPRRGSSELIMPVVGVQWHDLQDSYGDPRSGGRRHQGVDIFAPRWTETVAVTDGTIADIGTGGLGGRSIWLQGRDGRNYYYAHLEDWAEGIRRGMRVQAGDLIAFVGNSGNARSTPTHLHFEVREGSRTVNPYYALADARPVNRSRIQTASASGGSRSWWRTLLGW